MKKVREIIGLPIILMDSGKEIFEIRDVLINPKKRKIVGFIVDEKGWFKGAKIIRYKDIYKIGKDAVLIKNKDKITVSTTFPELEGIIEDRYNLFNIEVVDDHGTKLGFVKNIGFDGRSGMIKFLEISDGVLADVMDGRLIIPLKDEISLQLEKILIPVDFILEFEKIGGLKKYFSETNRCKEDK